MVFIFSDNPDMPRLTDDELRIIEDWYRNYSGVNRDIMMGYNKQTGNSLIDVIRGE